MTLFSLILLATLGVSLWINLVLSFLVKNARRATERLVQERILLDKMLVPSGNGWFLGPDGKQYHLFGTAMLYNAFDRLVPYAVFPIVTHEGRHYIYECPRQLELVYLDRLGCPVVEHNGSVLDKSC